MKRNLILFAISIVVILSMVVGLASSTAQPGVSLGEPGFSLRYVSTIGVTGVPYTTDLLHVNHPTSIYIDNSNNLFTVEEWGHRLLGYDALGENILAIGHAGEPGFDEGYLNFPNKVIKDSSSNLWVLTEHAILAYDPAGVRQLVYPQDDPGNPGNDNGHFNHPIGIGFDQDGYLFVSDYYNHRIQVYRTVGFFLNYINTLGVTGVPGDDNLHFNIPGRIAFDSSNALYVMDSSNYRVQKCTSSDEWVNWTCTKFFGGTYGSNPSLGQLGWALGISIDSSDNVFIADGSNYRVLKCTPAGVCTHFVGTVGEPGSDNSHFNYIPEVTVDSSGKVYVADPWNMRIQVFSSAGVYDRSIGVPGVPYVVDAVHYNQPWGVATASNGGLYIYENRGTRLIKVNPDSSQAWVVGKAEIFGSGNDVFGYNSDNGDSGNPVETQDGEVFMPDYANNRIQIFDADSGAYLATFGNQGQGNSQFNGPDDVTINPTNQDILVADDINHRIQIYDSDWFYKTTIGETGVSGSDNGHFNRPKSVAVDTSGNVFVADSQNYRVQKCTTLDGLAFTCSPIITGTGEPGHGFDTIHPVSVQLDKAGRIYVVSDSYNSLQVYDANGAYLTSIGMICGHNPGQLCYPEVAAVDQNGNVFVADLNNHRIQIYSPGVPGWMQVNINGFGNPDIDSIPSLAVFKDHLYAGTFQSPDGPHHLFRTENIQDWEEVSYDFDTGISSLIAFDNQLLAGTWKGSIYKSPDGLTWTQEMTGTVDMGIASFSQFDNMLYAGTYCNSHQGVLIWKSSNGTTWDPFASNNLDPNACGVISSAEFNGDLYFGVADWTGNTGGRIWRTDGTTITEVVSGGFDDTDNLTPGGLAAFGGWIYASIGNPGSEQIWRSESGDPGSWSMVLEIGLDEPGVKDRTGLIVHDNFLYLTAQNDMSGMQVWRTKDGTTWHQVGYNGFGDSNNLSTEWSNSLAVFNNQLIIVVDNWATGAELWQYVGGLNYLPLITR